MSYRKYNEYKDFLKSKGIKEISFGSYASVYQHPKHKEVVVKVFLPGEDSAYAFYLNWCLKNQHNPYIPKIHDYKVEDEIGIVFMEKLENFTEDYFQICRQLERRFGEDIDDSVDWSVVLENSKDKHLLSLAEFLFNHRHMYCYDMHENNIMWRGEQLVITDPISPR